MRITRKKMEELEQAVKDSRDARIRAESDLKNKKEEANKRRDILEEDFGVDPVGAGKEIAKLEKELEKKAQDLEKKLEAAEAA